jgi:hypothetical protein
MRVSIAQMQEEFIAHVDKLIHSTITYDFTVLDITIPTYRTLRMYNATNTVTPQVTIEKSDSAGMPGWGYENRQDGYRVFAKVFYGMIYVPYCEHGWRCTLKQYHFAPSFDEAVAVTNALLQPIIIGNFAGHPHTRIQIDEMAALQYLSMREDDAQRRKQ